jgi:hypothetical protein
MPKIELAIKEAIDRRARQHIRRVAMPVLRQKPVRLTWRLTVLLRSAGWSDVGRPAASGRRPLFEPVAVGGDWRRKGRIGLGVGREERRPAG